MRPFRERNPVPIGIAGVLFIVLLLVLGLEAGKLPFVNQGHTVYADFTDAASLQKGNNVRINGVLVGKVSSVKLEYVKSLPTDPTHSGNIVRVAMKVTGSTHLGAKTTANIKIETLLGQVYVELNPAPQGTLTDNTITDTETPTSITDAFIGLGRRAGEINVKQLAKSFNVLSSTFANTPGDVHSALTGLEKVSTTIASRNTELQELLSRANSVTNTLSTHDAQIEKLINDSIKILNTLDQQRAVVHNLLVHTASLARNLTGLVAENRSEIGPALSQLHGTLSILRANQTQLDQTLHLVAPFVRDFTDTLGNGRWFETTVTNLTNGVGGLKLGNTGSR